MMVKWFERAGYWRWALPVAWMGVIFALSAQSQLPSLTPGAPDLQAIAGHLCSYAVLGLLWRFALAGAGVRRASWWALLIVFLYGLSDEFHQSFVPNRTPEIFDIEMDLLGASLALLAVAAWGKLRAAGPQAEMTGEGAPRRPQ
jgi:hypothetical protein